MGLAINGKKIIGLAKAGKLILGEVKNGQVIWQYLVATKLWTSATDSNLITNLQLDDKGLLYMVDTQSINRVGKNGGTVYATITDTGGICGDLTFNTALNSFSYVSKTDYWNKNNYSNLASVYYNQKSGTDYPTDVINSLYVLHGYYVSVSSQESDWINVLDNSNTSNSSPIDHEINTSLGTFYLQALDGFGSNSNFTAGDFLAYSSIGAKAYNASSSTALDLEGSQSSSLVSSTKVSYAPIGYDGNKVNYYLSNQGNNYTLFSATKSNSVVNLIYLTYSDPVNTNGTIEALVTDYDAYNNLVSNNTESTDGSNSSSSLVDVPSKFTSYSSEKDSSGNSHIYALNYNANSDWTKINKEKLIDLDAGYNVKKMVKNGNMLFIGENKINFISAPWKFSANNSVHSAAVDSSGNIYVGTSGSSVYKLDSTGKQVWEFTAGNSVNSVAVDNSGNIYAGTSGSSVYKLDSTGKQVWEFTADNYVYSVAVDNDGNVYAGTSGSSVYKLDSTGKQVWEFTADNPVYSVAVDSSGNVYAGTDDYSVYKLDSAGKQVWEFIADNPVHSVAVDSSGNVYAGTDNSSVYKLDNTGEQVWKFAADGWGYSVAVDSSGNVYAGTSNSSVYKLDNTGKQVWKFSANNSVNSVAVDSSGNVYAGTSGSSVYKLTPAGSNTATYADAQSRVEAIQIDKVMAPSLSSAFNLTTKDSSSNTYQPNSIAVSASNFAVASNATSASKTLLRSMCIDSTIYTDQSNTTGAQGVCGVPYDNTGAFINETGKLSYRKYSDFGTLVQYYGNSAIKGADPMVGRISTDLTNSTAIDWASNGNLYMQNSIGWNGNYASGYTDNTGDIAMAPIKGVVNAYLIHPSTGDIKVFDIDSLNVEKTLPQYHLTNVTNGTSDTIAVSTDGTICYGTKNKDAQAFFFENPDTGTLFKSIAFNSGYYLLDIASDGNNNFAVLYYNSTSKQVTIDWYTSKGSFIIATMFSATYASLPYGKIEIDPQNGNVGLIMGNNYSMWTLGGLSSTGNQYLPVGTPLYTIPSNGLILAGDSGQSVSSLTNPLGINSDGVTLLYPIDECPNGIEITFNDEEYDYSGGLNNSGNAIESIKIPKGTTTGTSSGTTGFGRRIQVTAKYDNNVLSFTSTDLDAVVYSGTGTHLAFDTAFFAIASVVAY